MLLVGHVCFAPVALTRTHASAASHSEHPCRRTQCRVNNSGWLLLGTLSGNTSQAVPIAPTLGSLRSSLYQRCPADGSPLLSRSVLQLQGDAALGAPAPDLRGGPDGAVNSEMWILVLCSLFVLPHFIRHRSTAVLSYAEPCIAGHSPVCGGIADRRRCKALKHRNSAALLMHEVQCRCCFVFLSAVQAAAAEGGGCAAHL